MKSDAKSKWPRWSSPWLLGFAAVAVLYMTGLLDQGFFYLDRRYYAPWSIGADALTGAWESTTADGAGRRRWLLSIALLPKRRSSHARNQPNMPVSRSVWIIDGRVRLQGALAACPDAGKAAEADRYALDGRANENASDVELWNASTDAGKRLASVSLSGAWHGRELPASLSYVVRSDAAHAEHTLSVTFHKLDAGAPASRC
jgi:hypothetical protein